jgi:D-3-phosphoglycerate dehydrogenase
MDLAPSLRWIVTPTTGTDHVDVAAASARGIDVVSLRGAGFLRDVSATAEHTFALLLALARRVVPAAAAVRDGEWRRDALLGLELRGRVLGIVGLGRLGRMVAGYGRAFDMSVLACDTDPGAFAEDGGVTAATLDDLLRSADVVTVHVSLDEATTGLLGPHRIASMKHGALLVNTARGEVVDEAALLDALRSGRLGGAALDVLSGDASWAGRVPPGHPLVAYAAEHDNLLLTPHIGGYASDAVRITRARITEEFLDRLSGGAHAER